jgi:hypothetical protein
LENAKSSTKFRDDADHRSFDLIDSEPQGALHAQRFQPNFLKALPHLAIVSTDYLLASARMPDPKTAFSNRSSRSLMSELGRCSAESTNASRTIKRSAKPIENLPYWFKVVSTARSAAVSHFLLTLLFTGLPWRAVRVLRWSSVDLVNPAFIIEGKPIYVPDVVYSMLLTRRRTSVYVFERFSQRPMSKHFKWTIQCVHIAFNTIATTHAQAKHNAGIAVSKPLTRAETEAVARRAAAQAIIRSLKLVYALMGT